MPKKPRARAFWALLGAIPVALAPVIINGSAEPPASPLTSHWRDGDVKIDGGGGEWDQWSPFGQDSRLSVSLLNDERTLYMALRTSDPAVNLQMLRLGLIVWFDAEGGSRKRFGLKYPVGTQSYGVAEAGRGRGGPDRGGRGSPRGPDGSGGGNLDSLWSQAEADGRLNRLELVGARSEDRRTLVLGRTAPLDVRIGWHEGTIVYELSIPLTGDQYAIGVKPPRNIGIGLENAERDSSPGPMRFGVPGLGGGSGGGSAPPGGGGRTGGPGEQGEGGSGNRPEERPKPPRPLNEWVVARLSAKP
jgi:hypothetical protein